ncbi:unnamed protein product [Adineta steineri]|uniref:Uncharacterized protein n=1 Tax=Adineta steineri TaxID=433720 RepID=A0A818XSH7_9BILA|nr:unnamed protein product [Adineta steineri]
MNYSGTGAQAAQSFAYLLTELPLLKRLILEYPDGIDSMTYMSPVVVNNAITNLTVSLRDQKRLIPLLYRFEALKTLNIYFPLNLSNRKMARRDDLEYYRSQLREKTSIDYSMKIRQINIYHYPMILDKVDQLFQLISSSTLVTLSLFNCERPVVRYPMTSRQPPFLDGAHWHDLLKKYLSSSMKRFYIEYKDIDETMSISNPVRVKKELMKYNRSMSLWKISCSYNQDKKLFAFNFSSM